MHSPHNLTYLPLTSKILKLSLAALLLMGCRLFSGAVPTPTSPARSEPIADPQAPYLGIEESPAPDQFSVVRIEPGTGSLQDILQAEAQKASALGRLPFVEFYADWCGPCNALRDSLGDPRMVDAFAGTYIVKLDIDYWESKLSDSGMIVLGVPAFYELDTSGTPTGRMITGAAWGEDVPANIAPPMKAFFAGEIYQ